jgi:hypothetical protein
MIEITKLSVKSLDVDYLDIFWEIKNTYEDPWDYTFEVERSESALGPFDPISDTFSDRYHYRDVMVNPFHRHRQYWYRIKVTKKSDSSVRYSDPSRREPSPDLIAREVRRLEVLLMREFIGRTCWVFPVRTFGQRCPDCYDRVSRKRYRQNCVSCYDTSFRGGYLSPIATTLQIDPAPKVTQQTSLVETQQQNATARVPYFPPLKPRDILVEAENIRWQVVTVSNTQRLRAILHQEIQIHRLPESDIEFKLPINIDDLQQLETSPNRAFTCPQHLDAADGADWWTSINKGYGYD